jgi:hypothetical protein
VVLALSTLSLVAAPGPATAVIKLQDDFEAGNWNKWSSHAGLALQQNVTHGGSTYAAHNTASKGWASKNLGGSQADLYFRAWVNVRRHRDEFQVLGFRRGSGRLFAALAITPSNRLRLRNYDSRRSFTSITRIHRGWNDLQMRVLARGRRSRLTVWLDDDPVRGFPRRARLRRGGTANIELGNRTRGRRYDAIYDDVRVDTRFIRDLTIGAAGNIACDPKQKSYNGGNGSGFACHMKHTSNLLVRGRYNAVLALGDNQYICGGLSAYNQSYDPSWGRVYGRTYPVPGDKEYRTTNNSPDGTGCYDPPNPARGFRAYYANAPGDAPGAAGEFWYSFELGSWHVVALNSACGTGVVQPECGVGSPQYQFLQNDLQNSAKECTLVFFHHARFSSGTHGNDADVADFWDLMYNDGVELVLNAHDHTYERFLAQDPAQNRDRANGIVEFVLGTGGHSHEKFPPNPEPNSAVRNASTFGILEVALRDGNWSAKFVHERGASFTDRVNGNCH